VKFVKDTFDRWKKFGRMLGVTPKQMIKFREILQRMEPQHAPAPQVTVIKEETKGTHAIQTTDVEGGTSQDSSTPTGT
jgi:hypothetical protein